MTNIIHSSMLGAEVHEPKGINSASVGTVYVANGSGSGNWSNIGTSSFTGMIADFTWPVVQDGWLELDGSDININTYSALYSVMTIRQTGTRGSGSTVITNLPSAGNMRVGYYVFGSGIISGTTVVSVDSNNQITISAPAVSGGTAEVVVSPWLLNVGTIRLPDLTSFGRYRRSRSDHLSYKIGQEQADQNQAHTHGVSGDTSSAGADHTHGYSGTSSIESSSHTHNLGTPENVFITSINNGTGTTQTNLLNRLGGGGAGLTTSTANSTHTHTYSGTSNTASATHNHSFNVSTQSDGGTETRPMSLVVMTCVKT